MIHSKLDSPQRRQIYLASGAMVCVAAASNFSKPSAAKAASLNIESAIPRQFDGWKVDPKVIPIKPTPDAQAKLDQIYDQLVNRTYMRADKQIMLSIAYGSQQTDKLKAHRQEVCYAAQGFRISHLSKDNILVRERSVPVTRFLAVLGQRKEPVSYWFTMGNRVVDSRIERLITQVRHGFLGEIPDGLLVRISSIGSNLTDAYEAHSEFANALLTAIEPVNQSRFIGTVA
jgi:EpsI family protein